MIKRHTPNRHAPVPTNDNAAPVERKSVHTRPVEVKELKLSKYWQGIYREMFRGW